jgi:hypothetical protein
MTLPQFPGENVWAHLFRPSQTTHGSITSRKLKRGRGPGSVVATFYAKWFCDIGQMRPVKCVVGPRDVTGGGVAGDVGRDPVLLPPLGKGRETAAAVSSQENNGMS